MADVFAGRFELIDPVGSGGNSLVWRAWDRRLGRVCAAKVLRQRHAGALLRFVREQGLRLDHPHVLSPYSWAAEDDQALLAMDLVGGGSVSSLLADFGALPERYAAELLAQLLGALGQVHAAGLVHRDVKPANLLLEATGTGSPVLRLSDFGIALSLGEPRLTQHGAIVGTPGYVAPEALAGQPPSISQDLYAVGVTGWQLLTGQEPPATGVPLHRPLSADAADPADAVGAAAPIGAGILWQVVEDLMHPDTGSRTPSAEDALAALAPVLAQPLELPASTPDGEPIEVFDHLPPLPAPYAALATRQSTNAPQATPTPEQTPEKSPTQESTSSAPSSPPTPHPTPPQSPQSAPSPSPDSVEPSRVGSNGRTQSAESARPGSNGRTQSAEPARSAQSSGRISTAHPGRPAGSVQPSESNQTPNTSPSSAPLPTAQASQPAGPAAEAGSGTAPGSGTAARSRAAAGSGTAAGSGGAAWVGRSAESGAAGETSGRGLARGKRWRVLVGGVGAAGVVAAAVVGAMALDGGPDGKSPGRSVSPSGGQASASSSGPSGGQSSEPTGGQSSEPTAGVSSGPVRTGGVTPLPNAGVKLGGACGWQEAGSVETTTDGTRVVCRQQASSYRWVRV
ncbi:protein kinase domain-containing protein [Kribbella sp. CA-294648]|uniref:serine/threonine-protein kinase n=1 Tax=Kribbella sp. CA-294648 TaxID=3239948 RepID=UPI003D905A0A